MLIADRLPQVTRGGRAGDGLSGVIGGVMGGLGGFPGVVPTLWCSVRGFGKDTQRSIIQNFNLSMLAVTFGSYVATGMVRSEHLPLFGVVAPALIVPSLLGARLYARISQVAFRKVLLALLTLSGAALVIAAVPRL
jgi:uncharacterized membrane protein YfcA